MNTYKRNIIILLKEPNLQPEVLEAEVNGLHAIIGSMETNENFCKVFELLNRNRITSQKSKILEFLRDNNFKPFRFLINKN